MRLAAVLGLALAVCSPPAWPQAGEALQLLGAEESAELRRVLAVPVPDTTRAEALRAHFLAQDRAARRLADTAARKAIVQQAMQRLPQDARWPNDMGTLLQAEGRWEESQRLYESAIEKADTPAARLFFESNLIDLLVVRHAPQAEARLAQARTTALALSSDAAHSPNERITVLRTLSSLAASEVNLHNRRGRLAEALVAATEGEQRARAALEAAEALAGKPLGPLRATATDLAVAQKRMATALRWLERDGEAEQILQQHLRTIAQYPVAADFAAGAHHALATLRLNQRAYAQAEAQLRLSLQVLDQLKVDAAASVRADKVSDLVLSLWAQGKYEAARAELERFDRYLAAAPKRPRQSFPRGLVALSSGHPDEAAVQFAELVGSRLREQGAGHYLVAQARCLQAVALWRSPGAAQREQGAELLRTAVPDLLAPRNADQDNDRGVRRQIRTLILAAYVDAMTRRGGLPALWAMGVADGQRGGITAQALADAALRAAANDPALAALVRQEQDARREMQAAEQLLQEATPSETLPPEAAARVRARVSELGLLRQQVQERLRERFPGYEQLVRPAPPDPAAVAQRLGRAEALLMLVPTEQALLAWVITADELPHFVRLEVGSANLKALVQRLRKGVDFAANRGQAPGFDHAAAHELYRLVLAPLEPRLRGAQHLIVSLSGALADLPLVTLLTEAPGKAAPAWLVRRWALTQVPSVSAWLSLRQLQRSRPAPEALMAWGDPSFGAAVPAARPQRALVLARNTTTGMRYADLPPLPETRDEILAIAASVKADPQRDLRLGPAATRESVLEASRSGELGKKRIVVFATHGLVAGDMPGLNEPALALAAPPAGAALTAGLLTLEDVLGLKLNADWVVLSACNSAAADGRGEEVLSGLARGFFYAGSRSVLVTQWAVETESAKLLTSSTFEHHAREARASKAESLRQAMLKLMAMPAYAHPAFWAPYMLVGDGAR